MTVRAAKIDRLITMRQAAIFTAVFLLAWAGRAQNDWPAYGHDHGNTHFSPLKQITPANVTRLHRAWIYHTGDKGAQFESTPIVVGNRMFLSTPAGRVVALEPETGKEIWKFDPKMARAHEHRGVAYWPGDSQTPPRVILATGDARLIAIDAASGQAIPSFGDNGVVNLREGVADKFPNAVYAITSPPAIYRNLIVVGPNTQEGPSRGPSGDPRAFDARTGKLVWRFHTVPQPGEAGNDTWGPDGWKDRSGPSLWGLSSVDAERGLVFLSTGNPADSFYGADRKGTNLYANCVLALDAATGKLRWFYQVVHHDIFDYDVTGGPALVDAVQGGKKVPAVAQITKMGFLFVLNRLTGQPVWGVEERAVPPSDLPGEQAWPTQPYPLKPPPLARVDIRREELTRRTPEAQRFCRELFDSMKVGPVFTPFSTRPTLVFPGAMGGGNWGGVAFDPALSFVFVNTSSLGGMGQMAPSPNGPMPNRNTMGYARFLDQDHYPCQQPPWGELSAVNTTTGEIAWRVTLGNFDELAAQGMTHTGTPNVGGPIATASGLVFIGASIDDRFRAFDSRTGKELWAARLEASGTATPLTYLGRDGNQYVAIAAGGTAHFRMIGDTAGDQSDAVVAFSLAGKEPEPAVVTAKKTTAAARSSASGRAALPQSADKGLVERMCARCHGIEIFASMRLTREGWETEVSNMVARGANGTPDEIRRVVDYLAKYLAAR